MSSTQLSCKFSEPLPQVLAEMRGYITLHLTRIGEGNWKAMVIKVTLVNVSAATGETAAAVKAFYNWLVKIPACKVVMEDSGEPHHSVSIAYRR